MKRAVGITLFAVLASVGGGISLSMAHTSGDGLMGFALFTNPTAPEDYTSRYGATPLLPHTEPVRVARARPNGEPVPTVMTPLLNDEEWTRQSKALSPTAAIRPKARTLKTAAIIEDVPSASATHDPAPALQPVVRPARISTRSRARTAPRNMQHSQTPRPDFLIGVYR